MKKLLFAVLIALAVVSCVSALAENIILPDPGYYFKKVYTDNIMWFDEYPIAEYEAYVALLTDSYDMQITESKEQGDNRICFLLHPDAEYAEAYVGCVQDGDGNWALQLCFWGDITLSAMETYTPASTEAEYNSLSGLLGSLFGRNSSDSAEEAPAEETEPVPAEVAWDDGRMITDPGDFLGYDIECIEHNPDNERFAFKYAAAPVDDILSLVEKFGESPYFERTKGIQCDVYWLFCFNYVGPDEELMQICADDRYKCVRNYDLGVYICNPYSSESEFYITQFPGFTVNTDTSNMVKNNYVPSGSESRCVYCGGDGRCDNCGGSGQVYDWIPGEDSQRRVNCTSCMNGSCTFCDGDGWY